MACGLQEGARAPVTAGAPAAGNLDPPAGSAEATLRRGPLKPGNGTVQRNLGTMRHTLVTGIALAAVLLGGPAFAASPYPPSTVIAGVTWDTASEVQLAPGSDLWPVTWAADGNLYTAFGDGGGFGGDNTLGRVSLGYARILGSPAAFTTVNVNGGVGSLATPTWGCTSCAKASGLLSVGGVLYTWLNLQNSTDPDWKLYWSNDLGLTWQAATWVFAGSTFGEIAFLNFGQDYAGARDGYVYMYGYQRPPSKTRLELARVPTGQITDRAAYEFFTGADGSNVASWSSNIADRVAVFTDPNGVAIPSAVYDAGIGRYLLTTAHGPTTDGVRKMGMFDAPEPWGPWTTVQYNEDWLGVTGVWISYNIPTKTPDWMSPDGRTIHLFYSSTGTLDSFNMIKGTLDVFAGSGGDTTPPSAPTGVTVVPVP